MAYTAIDQLGYSNLSNDTQNALAANFAGDGLIDIITSSLTLKDPKNQQSLIGQIGEDRYKTVVKENDNKLDSWLNLYLCDIVGYDKKYANDFKKLVLGDPNMAGLLLKLIAPFAKQLYWTMPDAKRTEVDHEVALPTYKAKWGMDWNKN